MALIDAEVRSAKSDGKSRKLADREACVWKFGRAGPSCGATGTS